MTLSANENAFASIVSHVEESIHRHVFGHTEAVRLLISASLIGGHVLVEGPPGIAKTLLAKSFAGALGLRFSRIQFTPDLMPADITGVSVYNPAAGDFRFSPGPLLSDIILADEINRTPPKTQAALLEAMEERHVTIDGVRHDLGEMFFVIATQNPIEYEGTFPLPEAQLDRFFYRIRLGYPDPNIEEMIIANLSGVDVNTVNFEPGSDSNQASIPVPHLLAARREIRSVTLAPAIVRYIADLVRESRKHPNIQLGASPRAALCLALSAKCIALLDGRNYVVPDDVQASVIPVFSHRLILSADAYEAGRTQEQTAHSLLESVAVPSLVS